MRHIVFYKMFHDTQMFRLRNIFQGIRKFNKYIANAFNLLNQL